MIIPLMDFRQIGNKKSPERLLMCAFFVRPSMRSWAASWVLPQNVALF
jgi:hypothetical protein